MSFLKASLLEFISALMLPSVDALRFSATVLRVEGGTCSVKSELLDQGTWLGNNDTSRTLLRRLECFGGPESAGGGQRFKIGIQSCSSGFKLGNDDLLQPLASTIYLSSLGSSGSAMGSQRC